MVLHEDMNNCFPFLTYYFISYFKNILSFYKKDNNFVIYNDQDEEITYKKLLYKLNEIIGEQKSKQNTILPINDDVIVSL